MIVIADTSPLSYLIRIGHIDVLPQLYRGIVIPSAQEFDADELIIDDMAGRREAQKRNLHFIGTLGVLRSAASNDLLDLKEAVFRLRATNFHVSQELLDKLMADERR